jgi:hypothetical protein
MRPLLRELPVRQNESPGLPSPFAGFPHGPMEQVFDDSGLLLADVRLLPAGTQAYDWEMEPLNAAPLLDYLFSRSGGFVRLGPTDAAPGAWLLTAWRGGRRIWWLKLVPQPDSAPEATRGPVVEGASRSGAHLRSAAPAT